MPDDDVDLTGEPPLEGGLIYPQIEAPGAAADLPAAEPTRTGSVPGPGSSEVDRTSESPSESGRATLPEIDLTADPPAGGLTVPEQIELGREAVRRRLAWAGFWLLAGLLAATYLGLATGQVKIQDTKEFLAITLPAVTAITSGAIGFYFGQPPRNGR